MERTVAQQIGADPLPRAYVALKSGGGVLLSEVAVRSDSLIGYANPGHERRAVARRDVAYLETRSLSTSRTLAVLAGTALLAAVAFYVTLAIAFSNYHDS